MPKGNELAEYKFEELAFLADGVAAIDSDLKLISFSPGASRITGYPAESILGKGCEEIFGPDLGSLVRQVLKTGEASLNQRIEILTADRDRIPTLMNLTPLHDPEGQVVGVVQTFQNLVELYSLFADLIKERNRLWAILESIGEGVFTVDVDWRITEINRAAEQITGFDRPKVLGKSCAEVFRGAACTRNCPLRRAIETGQNIFDFETEIVSRSGRPIPVSVSTALLRDEEGEIMGGVEVFRDLSALRQLTAELRERYGFGGIVGRNPALEKVYELIAAVKDTSATVLIQGETGTGKELVARAIHYNSPRRDRPFIKVSCAAVPETLLESELFGYERGAFTGAMKTKPGRFELAHHGTIFLDEIGDIPKSIQAKLLRVLEEQRFERLGGTRTIEVDVRILAATNKDLGAAVRQGDFRDDLYYRLNVVTIQLPPLRERMDDLPLLIEHFLKHFNQIFGKRIRSISPKAMECLLDYPWPGNIRELEHALEHAFIRGQGSVIKLEHLPESISQPGPELITRVIDLEHPLPELERALILELLRRFRGDRAQTATHLGISRTTLWRKMKRYGLGTQS
jgi:PAS domain S-box-containing protein